MKLIKLWEADAKKAFDLYNTFQEFENGFTNVAYGFSFSEFEKYILDTKDHEQGINLLDSYVPDTKYVLEVSGDYVGIFHFRHHLNDFLENGPGHIGYGISPKHRKKGYATLGLKIIIEEVKNKITEDEIYMSVDKGNEYSLKVQLKNNAYVHHETDTNYLTRIKI